MDTTTDLVIVDDSIDTTTDNTEEGSNPAKALAGVAVLAAVAAAGYFGFGRFLAKRQLEKEIETRNALNEQIEVMNACDIPAEK